MAHFPVPSFPACVKMSHDEAGGLTRLTPLPSPPLVRKLRRTLASYNLNLVAQTEERGNVSERAFHKSTTSIL